MRLPIPTLFMVVCAVCASGKSSGNKDVSDVERLSNVVDVLVEQIGGLNKKVANQDRKIAEQDSKIANLVSENDLLKEMRIQSNTESTAVSRKERLLLMNQPHPTVIESKPAFTARLSKHLTRFGNQQAVIFDYAETNVGNHYSPVSGVFTAPTTGTYYFMASIVSFTGQHLATEIVINGHSRAYMYCNSHTQGTNGIVVAMKQGDLAWVRHLGAEDTSVYGYNWSTFTGFMI